MSKSAFSYLFHILIFAFGIATTNIAYSQEVIKLYTDSGDIMPDYDAKIKMLIEKKQKVKVDLGKGQTMEIGPFLGSGNTTAIFQLNEKQIIRLPLHNNEPANKGSNLLYLETTINGFIELEKARSNFMVEVDQKNSDPNRFLIVEKVNIGFSLEDFLLNNERYKTKNANESLHREKFKEFIRATAEYEKINDLRAEQIVWDETHSRFVLLDWSDSAELARPITGRGISDQIFEDFDEKRISEKDRFQELKKEARSEKQKARASLEEKLQNNETTHYRLYDEIDEVRKLSTKEKILFLNQSLNLSKKNQNIIEKNNLNIIADILKSDDFATNKIEFVKYMKASHRYGFSHVLFLSDRPDPKLQKNLAELISQMIKENDPKLNRQIPYFLTKNKTLISKIPESLLWQYAVQTNDSSVKLMLAENISDPLLKKFLSMDLSYEAHKKNYSIDTYNKLIDDHQGKLIIAAQGKDKEIAKKAKSLLEQMPPSIDPVISGLRNGLIKNRTTNANENNRTISSSSDSVPVTAEELNCKEAF